MENRVPVDVVKMRSHWKEGGPQSDMTGVLINTENLDTDVPGGGAHGTGVTLLQATEPPEPERPGMDPSLRSHHGLLRPASRATGQHICVV